MLNLPLNREAVLVTVATVGTTLAPWGLAFIQSYAADKKLPPKDLRYERIDVIVGAVLTGMIGAFVVIANAATLHAHGIDPRGHTDARAMGTDPPEPGSDSLTWLGHSTALLEVAAGPPAHRPRVAQEGSPTCAACPRPQSQGARTSMPC